MYKLSTSTTETTVKLKGVFISHKSDFKNVYIYHDHMFCGEAHGISKLTELRNARNFEAHGTSKRTELRKARNFEMSSKFLCILSYLNPYYSSCLTP